MGIFMEDTLFELIVDERNEFCTIHYDDSIINLSKNEIYEELNKIGVVVGINDKLIVDLISGYFIDSDRMIIASFISPSKGNNQCLSYLIDSSLNLKFDETGNADFYDIGIIKDIKIGDRLIEIIPPSYGTPGKNILGEEIEGILGNEIEIFPFTGEGTEIDEDGTFIVAVKDGIYRLSHKNEVSVVDELVVQGDLNFAVGNIDTTSTVVITGDLRAGFSCKSTSPIIVSGVIEDAEINTDGSLVCRMGILQGDKPISVKKQIKARYIRNRAQVECKNLFVQEMISGSNIRVASELEAKKLVGGTTIVRELVKLEELGSEQFIPTFIEVGVNPKIVKRLKELDKIIISTNIEIKQKNKEFTTYELKFIKFSTKISELLTMKNSNKVIIKKIGIQSKENSNKMNDCSLDIKQLKSKIDITEAEIKRLEKKIEEENPIFEVRGKVYPNVTIKIKNSEHYTVKTILKNVRFLYDSEEKKVIIETNE